MAETLMEYLESKRCNGFTAIPHYSPEGDCVTYFVKPDRCIADRIDELVTVYHSMKTNELVGCTIKGVHRILSTLGNFGVSVEDGEVSLGLFFMAAAVMNPAQKPRYKELGKGMGSARVKSAELRRAA